MHLSGRLAYMKKMIYIFWKYPKLCWAS